MANEKRNHFWLINLKIGESTLPPGRWQAVWAWSHRGRTNCRAAASFSLLGEGRRRGCGNANRWGIATINRAKITKSLCGAQMQDSNTFHPMIVPVYSWGGTFCYCFYTTMCVLKACLLTSHTHTHAHTHMHTLLYVFWYLAMLAIFVLFAGYFCWNTKHSKQNPVCCLKY